MHKAKSIAQEVSHARHKEDIIDIVDNVHPGEQSCKLKVRKIRMSVQGGLVCLWKLLKPLRNCNCQIIRLLLPLDSCRVQSNCQNNVSVVLVVLQASNSHKGPYEFEKIEHVQELKNGQHDGPIWCMKFSICGRLLATAGQDKILRIWMVKDAYPFFQVCSSP